MEVLIGAALVAAALVFLGVRAGARASLAAALDKDSPLHPTAGTIQAIIGAIAILVAGYWYFVERKGQPHADVSQTIEVHKVQDGIVAVEAHVQVKNLGTRLLVLRHALFRVQRVNPPLYDYDRLASLSGVRLWNAIKPRQPGATRAFPFFDEAEFKWPIIRDYDGDITHQIEPGETDVVVATFFIRCSVKTLRIVSEIQKEHHEDERPIVWSARSFVDLTKACSDQPKEDSDDAKP